MSVQLLDSLFHSCKYRASADDHPLDATLVPSPDMDTVVWPVEKDDIDPISCQAGLIVWSY
jgi:hypothetical protein